MKPKLFLSGGGTLGSVMPLLAVWEILQEKYDCFWIGSFRGMERELIKKKKIHYLAIPAGKIRKYFSVKNIGAPFFIIAGFLASIFYLLFYRPKAVVVSGSFISVPLVWAAWILGVRRVVHQEDIKIGLAGRLAMPFASVITTAFKETAEAIKRKNVFWIGNPVRRIFKNPDTEKWQGDLPLVLVLGGGLGSEKINQAVTKIAPELGESARLLHLTGKNKTIGLPASPTAEKPFGFVAPKNSAGRPTSYNYKQVEFLGDDLAGAMVAADIIVSRAGLSTISELAFLGKPAVLIPLSGVGQMENAEYLAKKGAAVIVEEKRLDDLKNKLTGLFHNSDARRRLGANISKIFPPDAAEQLAGIVASTNLIN
ncbi:MAG: UDP-N-acetylglucosamine--N-acetylmuramyl-(pentapeptide) pyrophosphoryl-undecaprenol N-acetylglucosamine transferase [bacterium]